MIEEYAYQLVGKQSEVIDKAVMAILRVKAPFTLKLAKLAQFRWVWKALGIDLSDPGILALSIPNTKSRFAAKPSGRSR